MSFNEELYSPRDETRTYTIFNTIDVQVKIPDDALVVLKEW